MAKARFDVHGAVDAAASSDADGMIIRVFRFPDFRTIAYDGSPGWNYSECTMNLIRAQDPGVPAVMSFTLRFNVASVGRHTVGYWIINALFSARGVALREVALGNHEVRREPGPRHLQGSLSIPNLVDLSAAEFNAIDDIHLSCLGQQDSL